MDGGTAALAAEFERRAVRDPQAVCVESADGTRYTRAQVEGQARRIAELLVRHGVGPGSVVGLHMQNSAELIWCVAAIFKCGAVYLPLDPALPPARIERMLARARPVLVLSESPSAGWGPWPVVAVDGEGGAVGPRLERAGFGRTAPDGHAPACIVFTSGSTGEPKGALLPVSALVTYARWCRSAFGPGERTRIAQLAPICFDVSLQETVASLLLGRTIVAAPPRLRRNPAELTEWLERRQVHHVLVPNVLLAALCDAALSTGAALPRLRHVIQAGDQLFLSRSLAAFMAGHPRVTVRNNYGATEMQDATSQVVDAAGELGSVCPIGRPVDGYVVHVLDERLNPVRRGEVGELYVAGPGIALGYVNDAPLTASRFVADPFGPPPGRLYRTKDLVFEDPDGRLVHVGRADEEVKVNGVRVHPAEVESVLREHPAVREAAIVPFDKAPGTRAMAAFVVLGTGDTGAVRDHLANRLPAYSLPARIIECGWLPVTDTGKVDRRSLAGAVGWSGEPPAGLGTGELVLEVIRRAVGASAVTTEDNFIEVGGDSLAAIAVEGAVRKAGVELSAGEVLESGNLGELVDAVNRRRREQDTGAGVAPADRGHVSVRLTDNELLRMAKGR
jgi:amino acid adenylation domain-containing protein